MLLNNCPNCQKELPLTPAQREKVEQALTALTDGKTLKITCPLCRKAIQLKRDGTPVNVGSAAGRPGPKAGPPPVPPAPPDISWLKSGKDAPALDELVKDLPLAMVLSEDDGVRQHVGKCLEELGYQVEFPRGELEAKERMRFVNFAAVVLQSGFADKELSHSGFHRHMCQMPMATRRTLLYALIDSRFNTLYDLEALTNSANVVINDQDVVKMPLILKKAIHDHQVLFGPYLEILKAHNKL